MPHRRSSGTRRSTPPATVTVATRQVSSCSPCPTAFNRQAAVRPVGLVRRGDARRGGRARHGPAAQRSSTTASASCFDDDFLTTLGKVVDDNHASLVTNSWSDLEADRDRARTSAAYEQVFLQGAMQGIGFMFSSGDNGDELANSGIKQVDYPASDPYVTAVGGTSDAIGARRPVHLPDRLGQRQVQPQPRRASPGPSTGFLYGAGGGESSLFNQPGYQRGHRSRRPTAAAARCLTSGSTAIPRPGCWSVRRRPSPTARKYGEYRIGGTSLASPLFAGMTALRSQSAGTSRWAS